MERPCRLALLLVVTAVSFSSQDKLPAGGCLAGGELVAEGSLVPQQDPCHVCHCHRGRVECFWKSCAPPPRLCEVMQLEDRCNPSLYVCPIPASVADAPIHSAPSLLTEARQPAPETPRPQVTAPVRGRGRSRSRSRSSRVRSSRLRSSRLRTPNSASAPTTAAKPSRLTSRRRRPTVKPAASAQTVTRTQVRSPQTVTRSQVRSPQTVTRSQVRSPRPTRRRPGTMKIRLGPPVLPLVQPLSTFLPPPQDVSAAADSAVAASVLSGSTYFNEELSVPQNFTMPQGRGRPAPRTPQQLLSAAQERKPFRFGPSRPKTSSEPETEVAKATEQQPVTELPQTTTTTTTEATTTTTTAAPKRAGRGRGFRRTGRRLTSGRRLNSSPTPTRRRTSSRRVVSPPRSPSARRSRLGSRRTQTSQRATAAPAAVETQPTPAVTETSTTAPEAPVVAAEAPAAAAEAPAAAAAPPTRPPSRRAHARSRGKLGHKAVPVMTFDYDLEESINPADFMFPEFGRRLRRALPEGEVFDAEAVRRLEEVWSARQRRRRRSLLPGDGNHVHGHDHERVGERAKSCSILGVKYELGEVIGVASDNCMECRCAAQAMFCSPKCCFFSLEERGLREARQRGSDQEPPRPHPLQAYIRE